MTTSQQLYQVTAYQPTQPMSSREQEKVNRKESLRSLLIVSFILQIFTDIGLTKFGGLSLLALQAERIEHPS
ncbi:MAG: hypothetical protein HWQ35_28090 [Nostoc sp. NMS1]|uniref:hypothetical protein n=1 Tax=unclassified Nostoc TaxID=2593658 RepID=UPI0025FB994D|nr:MULTISPECIES: hypothetical protein [unclassified Nostoc]MBN3910264.1 hypothetical protein [Nostoc sp. NMS1]MBN3993523.1 hypothetical protein [Nostoc sp. NMS2]